VVKPDGVGVFVGVCDGVRVLVGGTVADGVSVGVFVAGSGVSVAVGVLVFVGVEVEVGVGLTVGVGVLDPPVTVIRR
jgi:hypothetical protein